MRQNLLANQRADDFSHHFSSQVRGIRRISYAGGAYIILAMRRMHAIIYA
jgi:hypothetical protein